MHYKWLREAVIAARERMNVRLSIEISLDIRGPVVTATGLGACRKTCAVRVMTWTAFEAHTTNPLLAMIDAAKAELKEGT